jgi:hypothetical protein
MTPEPVIGPRLARTRWAQSALRAVMPRMISANLNASTMMIADKASDMIRGKAAPEAAVIAGQGGGFAGRALGRRVPCG